MIQSVLYDQFVWIIITKKADYHSDKPSLLKKTRQMTDDIAINISKALGKKTVKTKTGEEWHLWKMYTDCGIKTKTEIYGNKNSSIYGYCNGIDDEMAATVAKARGLSSQGENKKYQNSHSSAKVNLPSPAHHKQLNTVAATAQKLAEKVDKNEVTSQIMIDGLKSTVTSLQQKVADQEIKHKQEIDDLKKTVQDLQKQIQANPPQAATAGTSFWNSQAQNGNVTSQSQQTSQTSNTSTSAPRSKR